MVNYQEQFKILVSGAKEVVDASALEKALFESEKYSRPLKVKVGTDPTAPSLHIGHMTPIYKLKQFQDFGHQAYFLIGDFTARIGDPSGKTSKRTALPREQVEEFGKGYLSQVFKILDPEKTKVFFNSSWFESMNLYDFVTNLAPKYTIAQLLARDDFNTRYTRNIPIAVSEFLYPLLQAYDSVALNAEVEVGGNDQLFNFLVAREIQRLFGQKPELIITVPTIKGIDGKEKMSKSLENTVNLSDSPSEMFGKLMSIPDSILCEYLIALSSKSSENLMLLKNGVNPRDIKEELASEITCTYHGEELALLAKTRFREQFSEKKVPENVEEKTFPYSGDSASIVSVVFLTGIASSKSEVRRIIQQKGLRIDGRTVCDPLEKLLPNKDYVINMGKRKYVRVRLKNGS